MSGTFVPLTSTVARWFISRRSLMTGIVKVGTGAGQFTLPLLASVLIANFGWRNAYVIIGLAAMVSLVAIAQLLKRDPSQIAPPATLKEPGPTPDDQAFHGGLSLEQAVRTVQFWTICIINLTLVFCLMSIMVHIVPHACDVGVAAPKAAGVLAAIGAVSMLGRFVAGMAIDRIGSKKVMMLCFFLLICGLLWLQTADALWMLLLFAGVYGIAHGGFFTAISPLVAEFFGITSHGALLGIVICFGAIGGAAGPIIAGYIFDITESYRLYFCLISLLGAADLGLLCFLKPARNDSI